jgi:hypothetical protein
MPNYVDMATTNLVDLLAQETEKFTQLMAGKEFTPEYDQCKQTIQQILAVIESRKETTVSEPPATFSEPNTTA